MVSQIARAKVDVERKIANVAAGHKMAGFDVTDADREMISKIVKGEVAADQVVAEILAENTPK